MSEERRSDDEERQRQGARKNGLCRDVGELLLVQQQQERTKKADAGSRERLLLNVLVERRQPRIPLSLSPLLLDVSSAIGFPISQRKGCVVGFQCFGRRRLPHAPEKEDSFQLLPRCNRLQWSVPE